MCALPAFAARFAERGLFSDRCMRGMIERAERDQRNMGQKTSAIDPLYAAAAVGI
jgi:hypothetical protein